MILTGRAIDDAVRRGDIIIDPFDPRQLGPNSYDFRLGRRCKIYRDRILDVRKPNPTVDVEVGEAGLLIEPDRIFLVNTHERMGSIKYVPIIRGRSSIGRLGIFIDITADLIDIGSINQWTLQLHAIQPVRIYPGMLVGQVTFFSVFGDIELYHGKYANLEAPVASLSYRDHDSQSNL